MERQEGGRKTHTHQNPCDGLWNIDFSLWKRLFAVRVSVRVHLGLLHSCLLPSKVTACPGSGQHLSDAHLFCNTASPPRKKRGNWVNCGSGSLRLISVRRDWEVLNSLLSRGFVSDPKRQTLVEGPSPGSTQGGGGGGSRRGRSHPHCLVCLVES